MLSLLALAPMLAANAQPVDAPVPVRANRYRSVAPLPYLPAATLDVYGNGYGVAQQTARSQRLQARVMWIDCTANLDRYNTDAKITELVRRIKDIGFNTIVFDVKPIVGYTVYPSKLTPKLESWRTQRLPKNFDPLKVFVREAKANNIPLFVSLNAFSEGHLFAKQQENSPNPEFPAPGPGYDTPELQTVVYDPYPTYRAERDRSGEPWRVRTPINTWPQGKHEIGAFTGLKQLGEIPDDAYGVAINGDGKVWGRFDPERLRTMQAQNWAWEPPNTEPDSVLLVGRGEGAQYLEQWGTFRSVFELDSAADFLPLAERQDQIPLMMNPHDPRNQQRTLAFVREILTGYDVDGILFDDRLRFGGMNTDFSELTRAQFEAKVGEKLTWPDDVFKFVYGPGLTLGKRPGKYYDAWLSFRAETLRDWVAQASALVKELNPQAQFGIYAGSWYGEYTRFGNNYAAQDFFAGFPFMTESYRQTGFAHHLDLLITGCYYPVGTIVQAMERNLPTGRTVEAAGQLSNRAARDQAWTYAGIMLQNYWGNPRALESALQAAVGSTQGVMVFDLSHRFDEAEPILRRAFRQPMRAPHTIPGLLAEVRAKRARLDELGEDAPPVFIREGEAGAGH